MPQAILKSRGLQLAAATDSVLSEAEVADTVARDCNAIGFVSLAFQRNAKAVNLETACGLILRPTTFALKSGEYSLGHRLYLNAAAPPKQAAARGLLRYALSTEAQAIISKHQFVSQAVESIGLAEQPERMAHALNAQGEAFDLPQMRAMLADLKGARRLSSTFQFQPGTIDLDAASKLEVARLAALLQGADYAGKQHPARGLCRCQRCQVPGQSHGDLQAGWAAARGTAGSERTKARPPAARREGLWPVGACRL